MNTVMIPVLPPTKDRIRSVKDDRGISYDALINEFLTMYGSPSSSEQTYAVVRLTHSDK